MDSRQREKLLAQIPTQDLRKAAFEKLGRDRSVELMLEYQRQLEQIRVEAETEVPAGRIDAQAILIGVLVGAGFGAAGVPFIISSSPEETVKGVMSVIAVGVFFGGGIGLGVGTVLAERAKNIFIRNREEPVQKQHRELLEEHLYDDQVTTLFLQIAAEE